MTMSTSMIEKVLAGLNKAEEHKHYIVNGYTHPCDVWHAEERLKYIALDCGTSGAFLVDKATGELYNIKAYGVPDQNKKRKANLGNIATVDPAWLHARRYNYLR